MGEAHPTNCRRMEGFCGRVDMHKINIKFLWFVLIFSGLSTAGARGQEEGISLAVWPTAEAQLALKYQLLPRFSDQRPGNAANVYKEALAKMPEDYKEDLNEEINRLQRIHINNLEIKEVEAALEPYKPAIAQVKLAACCEECEWGLSLRHPNSINILSEFNGYWYLSKVIALQAKGQIAEKKFDEAVETLQMGFALAKHISQIRTFEMDVLVNGISQNMLDQVENFIQTSESHNLFWALSGLTKPFIDKSLSMRQSREYIFITHPQLHDRERKVLSQEQAEEALGYLASKRLNGFEDEDYDISRTIKLLYPAAREFLKEKGYSPEKIEAMSSSQVILIHQLADFDQMMDELYRWFYFPYGQAQQGWKTLMKEWGVKDNLEYSFFFYPKYDPEKFENISTYIAKLSVVALNAEYRKSTYLDQKIAALQCIEAMRMYAADHEGKLPKSLRDIQDVPIPLNPFTGEDFIYKWEDDKVILVLANDFEYPHEKLFYEITIKEKINAWGKAPPYELLK